MLTVHKYPVEVNDRIVIGVPMGAQLLSVQMQYGFPTFWFLVDTEEPVVQKVYLMYGTGHEVQSNTGKHVESVQELGGKLVWHIFEEAK